jgi:hypothetical protein
MKHVHVYRLLVDYGSGENTITTCTDLDYVNKVYAMQRRYLTSNAIIILYRDRQYLKSTFGKGK